MGQIARQIVDADPAPIRTWMTWVETTTAARAGARGDGETVAPTTAAGSATAAARADDVHRTCAGASETRRRLGVGVATAIVQRLDLQILRPHASVAVSVLNTSVRKLHVPILLPKVVLDGPTMNLFRRAIGPAVTVRSTVPACGFRLQPEGVRMREHRRG